MKTQLSFPPAWGLWLIVAVVLPMPSLASQLEDARQCTEEPQRLERLACFDGIFGTPVEASAGSAEPRAQRPQRWVRAYAQEQARTPDDGPLYSHTGAEAGHLVTLAALAVLVVMQVVKAGSAMIGDRLTGHRPPHKDGEPEDRSDG